MTSSSTLTYVEDLLQSSPASRHFLPFRSWHSSQYSVLKHPQSMFVPYCERPSFIPIKTAREIIIILTSMDLDTRLEDKDPEENGSEHSLNLICS
jgi:hypothetical protein